MKALASTFLVLCFAFCIAPARAKRAPPLELKDLHGHSHKLAALHGQIVVLNFWATWCGPCQEELPRLSKLAQSYSGRNVRFIAVSIYDGQDRASIEPALERAKVTLETWLGADTDTLSSFGLSDIVPGTAILDECGEII